MNNWHKFMGEALEVLGTALEEVLGEAPMALGAALWEALEVLGTALEEVLGTALMALGAALEKKGNNGSGLILPPGAGLRDMLHVIYPPKTAERVFDQIIADMQLEWQEAMIHDQKWLANWIQVRGVLTVLLTVLVHAVAALGSIFKLVK